MKPTDIKGAATKLPLPKGVVIIVHWNGWDNRVRTLTHIQNVMGRTAPMLVYGYGSDSNEVKFIDESDKDFFVELLDRCTSGTASTEVTP